MMKLSGRVLGAAQVASALSSIPSLLIQGGERAMKESLEIMSTVMRRDFLSGPYPTQVARRSGSFAASWRRGHPKNIFQITSAGTKLDGTLGSTDIRARILDEGTAYLPGGVLRPKTAKHLALPTGFALTPNSSIKKEFDRPLREIPNTFFIRTQQGGLMLWQRTAPKRVRGARLSSVAHPLFNLVKSVTIRGRRYVTQTVTKSTPLVNERFQVMVTTIIDRTNQTLQKIRGSA